MTHVNIILNFHKFARYAFNALVGALEGHIDSPNLSIKGARDSKRLQQMLQDADPDSINLVLWTFYSPSFIDAGAQLQQLKQDFPVSNIIHLAGGVHATAEPLQTLKAGFDYIAVGEGEQIIVDVARKLLNNESIDEVQGIAYLQDDIVKRNGRGQLVDLNDYPPFAPKNHKFGPIEITRGCIYACKFCQTPYVSKAKFRHRSVEHIAEYAGIMRAHGFNDYRFISPSSLSYGAYNESVNLDQIEYFLSSLRQAVGKDARIFFGSFPSEIRPEHISIKALRVLKKYIDNDNINIGGQSGSQLVLDNSKRGHTVEEIITAVELTTQEGLGANVDFLFGLPGETDKDRQLTTELIQRLTSLGAKIHTHTFMPLPGTPFKHESVAQIDPKMEQVITEMENKGLAYGQWQAHRIKAQELVRIRSEK
ncbi:MAG: TIGR04013 family B12-binding domain/radical SAM domain-containing protein [Gammaproteobacteria bacterium]|nr:TIGR04013 family B12-binding domain/radical SAM domain-containing protein [Gammaproteobacteria bacterium]